MKYGLVCLLALCLSLNASAGFLSKMRETKINAKDLSKCSKKDFIQKYELTQGEYEAWLKGVVESLTAKETLTIDISKGKGVSFKGIRVKQFEGEQIIAVHEDGKVFLTGKAIYKTYKTTTSSDTPRCYRLDYKDLAMGGMKRHFYRQDDNLAEKYFDGNQANILRVYFSTSEQSKLAGESLYKILINRKMLVEKEILAEQQKQEALDKQKAAKENKEKAKEKAKQEKEITALLSWDDSNAKMRAKAMQGKTIVFKSFYLGMPIEDAKHLLYKKMHIEGEANCVRRHVLKGSELRPELRQIALLKQNMESVLMGYSSTELRQVGLNPEEDAFLDIDSIIPWLEDENLCVVALNTYLDGLIVADPDGNVVKIMLDAFMIDRLFNSANLDGEHFAEQFRSAYRVPYMEPTMNSDSMRIEWVCTTKDGAKLTIDFEKTLALEKVASQAEWNQTFD